MTATAGPGRAVLPAEWVRGRRLRRESSCPVSTSRRPLALALLGTFMLLTGCDRSEDGGDSTAVNGSVHVPAGKAPGVAETVNGGIDIDDHAAVTVASTVNGGIKMGADASAERINTVNGSITLGPGAHVAKSAESVNGGVILRDRAEVLGRISNVNGKIELSAAHAGGGIETVNGDILIDGASHVEGGILVRKTHQIIHFGNSEPRIVIGPGASVRGELSFGRDVKLYVSDRATIGPVVGATPIPFSGDAAPAN